MIREHREYICPHGDHNFDYSKARQNHKKNIIQLCLHKAKQQKPKNGERIQQKENGNEQILSSKRVWTHERENRKRYTVGRLLEEQIKGEMFAISVTTVKDMD
jgi:hypothetical protein